MKSTVYSDANFTTGANYVDAGVKLTQRACVVVGVVTSLYASVALTTTSGVYTFNIYDVFLRGPTNTMCGSTIYIK